MNKLLFLLCLLLSAGVSNADAPWRQFLDAPTEKNYFPAAKYIKSDSTCEGEWHTNYKYAWSLMSLFSLISSGNENAFKLGLVTHSCLDGGNLGDYYRSVGLFFEKKPNQFFTIVQEEKLTIDQIMSMVTSSPLELVDKIDKQMESAQNRIHLVETLSVRIDNEIKIKIISTLNDKLNFLENIPPHLITPSPNESMD